MSDQIAAMRAAAEDRLDNYTLLARLFRCEVDKPLLEDLISGFAVEKTGNADFDEGASLVRSFLDGIEDIDKGKSALAIDYCLTFLGYGVDPEKADETGANAAYPYEAMYVSGGKTLGGDQCNPVIDAYGVFGFSPNMERIISRDHMSCELAFIAFLADREIEAFSKGDAESARTAREAAASFFSDHLLKWIAPFEEAVDAFSETDFYRGLVRMTRGAVTADAAELAAFADDAGKEA